jgi:hypothetical protein
MKKSQLDATLGMLFADSMFRLLHILRCEYLPRLNLCHGCDFCLAFQTYQQIHCVLILRSSTLGPCQKHVGEKFVPAAHSRLSKHASMEL